MTQEPLLVELAPLPREQMGPFLMLGLDKDASAEAIEAHWRQRLAWAERGLGPATASDLNWARDVLNDPQHRVRADVASLNVDTTARRVRQQARQYGLEGGAPLWQPLDIEEPPAEPTAVSLPDPDSIGASIVLPAMPPEAPAAAYLLAQWVSAPLDPWAIELTDEQR
ncbi:MAG TPA: hypothetical protein VFA18_22620 [Gemmataceae bacterium]|nr:hypothetical protein [Gemmataceae bacterium]